MGDTGTAVAGDQIGVVGQQGVGEVVAVEAGQLLIERFGERLRIRSGATGEFLRPQDLLVDQRALASIASSQLPISSTSPRL